MVQREEVGLRPVRLSALAAVPTAPRRRQPPPPPTVGEGPFGRPTFKPMRIITLRGDHVVAAVDGSIGEYAIGHLPLSARALMRPGESISVSLADGQKRTMLGILADKAIEDVHDREPRICPVAVAIIRAHARSPEATIRSYLEAAPHVGVLKGQEFTLGGESLIYEAAHRRLTVEWRGSDWNLSRDRLEIQAIIPATACVACIGQPVSMVVEHPMFDGSDAIVTGIRPEDWGTEIHFEAKPLRTRALPEAGRRGRR